MSSNQNQNDGSQDAMYVGGFLILLYIIAIMFFGEQLTMIHLWMRKAWAVAASTVLPFGLFENVLIAIESYSPREWMNHGDALTKLSKDLRLVMFIPLGGFFLFYAWHVWKETPSKNLRRRMDREKLIKSEVKVWPWIAPVVGLDIVKESIDKGKWAMAKTPVDFSKRYRLLDGREVNKPRAEKLFASQLGKLWEGPEQLPPHVRALFACFIAQACRDKDGSRDGLRDLSLSFAAGNPDYSFVNKLLSKHYEDERVQAIFEKHAYVVTVLCASLELARKNGVLPPSYFIWLRPYHRSLWYALNNTGRRVAFCEVAGVHAHYMAEKVAGHRIERPYVVEAVKALEQALREYKFD